MIHITVVITIYRLFISITIKYIMHMSMGRDHFWKTGEDLKKKILNNRN